MFEDKRVNRKWLIRELQDMKCELIELTILNSEMQVLGRGYEDCGDLEEVKDGELIIRI